MPKEFTISYLESEEFDKLPYKRINTSGGVTDMNKKKIYIRKVEDKNMQNMIKQHELMESKLKNSPDEPKDEDGIRYFSLKKLWGGITNTIKGLIGGFDIPESPKPIEPPSPAPVPIMSESSVTSAEESRRRRLAKLRTGLLSTIKTSPRGITGRGADLVSSVATGTKTLGA